MDKKAAASFKNRRQTPFTAKDKKNKARRFFSVQLMKARSKCSQISSTSHYKAENCGCSLRPVRRSRCEEEGGAQQRRRSLRLLGRKARAPASPNFYLPLAEKKSVFDNVKEPCCSNAYNSHNKSQHLTALETLVSVALDGEHISNSGCYGVNLGYSPGQQNNAVYNNNYTMGEKSIVNELPPHRFYGKNEFGGPFPTPPRKSDYALKTSDEKNAASFENNEEAARREHSSGSLFNTFTCNYNNQQCRVPDHHHLPSPGEDVNKILSDQLQVNVIQSARHKLVESIKKEREEIVAVFRGEKDCCFGKRNEADDGVEGNVRRKQRAINDGRNRANSDQNWPLLPSCRWIYETPPKQRIQAAEYASDNNKEYEPVVYESDSGALYRLKLEAAQNCDVNAIPIDSNILSPLLENETRIESVNFTFDCNTKMSGSWQIKDKFVRHQDNLFDCDAAQKSAKQKTSLFSQPAFFDETFQLRLT